MAALYGREIIDTLHERMGGDAQLLGPANEGAAPDGAWGRLLGHWGHRDGDAAGILGGGGPEFDYNFGALQAGLDLYRRDSSDGQRDNAGIYLAIGQGSADVEHNLLGRTFKGGEDDFVPAASAATGPISARTTGISTAFSGHLVRHADDVAARSARR